MEVTTTYLKQYVIYEVRATSRWIEHRLTKPNHPWTNGQLERVNRTMERGP